MDADVVAHLYSATMRYIGNKTRLLGFIRGVLKRRGISSGAAVDPFCGTASVGRALKRWGFAVTASDLMRYGYVFARAYVEAPARPLAPELPQVAERRPADLRALLRQLDQLPLEPGFVSTQYSPATGGERMYFTAENAGRIDAIRSRLELWRRNGDLNDHAYYIILASLIEAADRVANTTGVYAAYVKSWQPNALRPLELRVDPIVCGNSCHAFHHDAHAVVSQHDPFELLYLDPPYNGRQYPGYYHIPEVIATGWFDGEPALRGKTGLPPDYEKRSDWCNRKKAETALGTLLENAKCRHIVMSYNGEGLIPEASIERLLKQHGLRHTYRRYQHSYKRYRSDSDREGRRYKSDAVSEYLYCVSR